MHILRKNFNLILLLIAGTIVWSLTTIKSGLSYSYGIGYWGPHGHDGIWHLAVSSSLSRWDFQMPIYAGESLKNYHIGFDLLLAVIHLVTSIPLSLLYFQILPPLFALTIGLLVYLFVKSWKNNTNAAFWAVFFTYFGGSFGWLVNLIRNGSTGGESMFWSQQAISTLLNPPYATSLILILLGLICLRNHKHLSILCFGLLSQTKIYAAIVLLAGLGLVAAYNLVKYKKIHLVQVFFFSLVINIVLILPTLDLSKPSLIWQPFWYLETMLSFTDRFNWPKAAAALLVYKQTDNYLKLFPLYFVSMMIFLIGNLGTRLLFLFNFRRSKLDEINLLLLVSSITGLIIALFFIQNGTPWNTIQFFYYSQFFLGILAGITIANLKPYKIFLLLIILVTLPTSLDTLRHYLPSRPPAMISNEEVAALKFLSSQPAGNVLTYPSAPNAYYPAPRPLTYYESTAYVAAYGNHPVFMEDEVNLNITGYDWRSRRDQSVNFFASQNLESSISFLRENNIRYIYLFDVSKFRPFFSAQQLYGKVVYENSQSAIWEISLPFR